MKLFRLKCVVGMIAIIFCFSATTIKAQINTQDSLALVDLYYSTNGSNWRNNTHWLRWTVSSWYGITVANNRVIKIEFGDSPTYKNNYEGGNNLYGSIPSSLWNLTALEVLNLRQNYISGTIPNTIGNLTKLKVLEMGKDGGYYVNWQLNGSIPSTIGQLIQLDTLVLSYSGFTGNIPSSIGNLVNLKYLDLSWTKLSGGIPTNIGSLINLGYLDLSATNLSGSIPTTIGKLVNLNTLLLTDIDSLTGNLPTEMGNLINLQNLTISRQDYYKPTNITGSIPASFGNLHRLKNLMINSTNLSGLTSTLGNLDSLQTLTLNYNQFTGSIPSSFGNLHQLQTLDLSYNNFTGNLPTTFNHLDSLNTLNLSHNNLSGKIPAIICGINTYKVDISYNKLTDTIPASLAKSGYIYLNNNLLTGGVPTSFVSSSSLNSIDLSNNNLSGTILTTIGNNSNLRFIALSYNHFTGPIPASLGYFAQSVYLNNNNLSGPIPTFQHYPYLLIGNNNFTFAGMEGVAQNIFDTASNHYAPQATVHLNRNGNKLWISVGGTPSNNTFKWYMNGILTATNIGDSTYTMTSNNKYWVVITNAVAKSLTLYSDTTTITNLPITLSSFTTTSNNKTIQTNWYTSTELNTSHFIIQHSTDGSSFTDIGTIKAIGNGANGYSFTDTHPTNGTNYYRLKSVDKDGTSSYSKVVSAQLTVDRLPFTVVPNPAKDITIIKGNHIAFVQVIDNIGRVVKVVSLKDATNPTLSVGGLQAGVYHLRVQTIDGKVSNVGMIVN